MAIVKFTDAFLTKHPLKWEWIEVGLQICPGIFKTNVYLHGKIIWEKAGFHVGRDVWPEIPQLLLGYGILCMPIEPPDAAMMALPELDDS